MLFAAADRPKPEVAMKRKILLCAAAMLFANIALAQPLGGAPASVSTPAVGANAQAQAQELPDGPGKALVQTACAQCHSIDVAISQPRSRDEWTEVVSRMIGNGAHLTDDDYNVVLEYLATHLGPPGPNAPADDHPTVAGKGQSVPRTERHQPSWAP
jgi:mono/diheme cytochrome c family protein